MTMIITRTYIHTYTGVSEKHIISNNNTLCRKNKAKRVLLSIVHSCALVAGERL